MKWINLPQTSNKREFLEKTGIPFSVYFTNNSTAITLLNEPISYFIAPNFLKRKDLNFIRKVKNHAKNLGFPDSGAEAKNINYFRFNNFAGSLENVVEIDVNQAYWFLANKLGYINEDLFLQGLETDKIGKMTRLIALGSLASKKKVFQFDGKNYHYIGYKVNPVLRSYFFHISLELDLIMSQIFNEIGDKALFYWFDAFFVNNQVADYIENRMLDFDLEIKRKEISELAKIKDKNTSLEYIKVKHSEKGKTKIRTFYLPNTDLQLKQIQALQI